MVKVPEVTLKIALDKNGAVDDLTQKPERFTSEESLDAVHRLRAKSDAIITGAGTVYRDNPSLTIRRGVPLNPLLGGQQPLRVVVDGKLTVPGPETGVSILCDGNPTVVYFTEMGPMGWVEPEGGWPEGMNPSRYWRAAQHMLGLLGLPVTFKKLPIDDSVSLLKERFKLDDMWADLEELGVFEEVMLESGPELARQFLDQGYVTRAVVIRAVSVEFTGQPVPSGIDRARLESAGLELVGETKWGGDEVEMWSRPGVTWPEGGDINAWP